MTSRIERLGQVATLAAALVSLLSLWSWSVGEWRALTFGPHYVPMAPVTGLMFVALAVVLLSQRFAPDHPATLGLRAAGVAAVVTVASVVLVQSFLGVALPWDQWLVSGTILIGPGIPAGRMSPTTAVAFLLSCLALAASAKRDDGAPRIIAISAGASLLIGLVVIGGYAVDAPVDYGSGRVPMALLSAVGFVLLNLGLLAQTRVVGLVRRRLGLGEELSRSADRSFALRLAATLIALLNLIGLAGLSYTRNELNKVRGAVWRELDAVADQKSRELAQWREERVAEGRFLQRTPQISRDVQAFLAKPGDAAARARVVGWLEPIRGGDRYAEALVFDARGNLRLALPGNTLDGSERIEPPSLEPPFLGPIHRSGPSDPLRMDLYVPLADTRPIGAIVLRLDPNQHLYPLVERWTTRLQTAEALLALRDGDRMVYLHNLRHRPNRGLEVSFPVTSPHLPTAMAARGELGRREGLDYRGEPVISSARLVSGSPWLLVAKIDQSEAYAPIRAEAWRSGLLLGLILLSVGLAGAYLWRERSAATLARTLAAEKERLALADRLAAVMRNANDIILLLDSHGRVLEANDRAVAAYGYPLDELVTMTTTDFRPDGDAAVFAERVREMTAADGARFESVHRRKDGSTFDVEISSRAVTFGDRQVILAVHRDISERKAAEAATAEARRTVNRLSEAMDQIPAYIYMKDRDGRYTYANRPCLDLFKRTAETLPGTRDADLFPPETVARLHALDTRVLEKGLDTAEEVTVTRLDGTRSVYWEIKTPIYEDADRHNIVGLCGISTDITNIKETEAALRVSEARHRLLADNVTDVIWTTDTEGRFTYVSPSLQKRRGFTAAEVMGQPFAASLTPASALVADARYREVKEDLAAGRPFEPFTLEIEQPCKDGSTIWSETTVSGLFDAEGRFAGALGVSRDIGERRRTQERLAAQLDELLRWQAAMLNREGRVRELKREVNELSARLGRPQPYASQEPMASAERVDPAP